MGFRWRGKGKLGEFWRKGKENKGKGKGKMKGNKESQITQAVTVLIIIPKRKFKK